MIQLRTVLNVTDNSGVLIVRCIRNLKKKRKITIGDVVLGSVRKISYGKKMLKQKTRYKKGELVFCIIIRVKTINWRYNARAIQFLKHAVIIVNSKLEPIASIIKGPISSELRYKGSLRLLTVAKRIL